MESLLKELLAASLGSGGIALMHLERGRRMSEPSGEEESLGESVQEKGDHGEDLTERRRS